MLKLDYPLVGDVFGNSTPASHNITSVGGFKATDEIKSRTETKTSHPQITMVTIHKCRQKVHPETQRGIAQAFQGNFHSDKNVLFIYRPLYCVSSINPQRRKIVRHIKKSLSGVVLYMSTHHQGRHTFGTCVLYLFWLLNGKRFDTVWKSGRHRRNISLI